MMDVHFLNFGLRSRSSREYFFDFRSRANWSSLTFLITERKACESTAVFSFLPPNDSRMVCASSKQSRAMSHLGDSGINLEQKGPKEWLIHLVKSGVQDAKWNNELHAIYFLKRTKSLFRPVEKHKMTGGAEQVAHINAPLPRFGPSVKAYCLVWKL